MLDREEIDGSKGNLVIRFSRTEVVFIGSAPLGLYPIYVYGRIDHVVGQCETNSPTDANLPAELSCLHRVLPGAVHDQQEVDLSPYYLALQLRREGKVIGLSGATLPP